MVKAFAIFDVKSDTFGIPFFMPATGMAVRAFQDLVNDPQSSVNKHPGDYKLVEIGSFDETKGELVAGSMMSLGFGTDYVGPAAGVPLGLVKGA